MLIVIRFYWLKRFIIIVMSARGVLLAEFDCSFNLMSVDKFFLSAGREEVQVSMKWEPVLCGSVQGYEGDAIQASLWTLIASMFTMGTSQWVPLCSLYQSLFWRFFSSLLIISSVATCKAECRQQMSCSYRDVLQAYLPFYVFVVQVCLRVLE